MTIHYILLDDDTLHRGDSRRAHALLSIVPANRRKKILQYRRSMDQRLSLYAYLLVTQSILDLREEMSSGNSPSSGKFHPWDFPRYNRTATGKPYVCPDGQPPFSVSHSGRMAACILAPGVSAAALSAAVPSQGIRQRSTACAGPLSAASRSRAVPADPFLPLTSEDADSVPSGSAHAAASSAADPAGSFTDLNPDTLFTANAEIVFPSEIRLPSPGIDVEMISRPPKEPPYQIMRRVFHPDEVREAEALPSEARRFRFYELWTRAEAYGKHLGTGLSNDTGRRCYLRGEISEMLYTTEIEGYCLSVCVPPILRIYENSSISPGNLSVNLSGYLPENFPENLSEGIPESIEGNVEIRKRNPAQQIPGLPGQRGSVSTGARHFTNSDFPFSIRRHTEQEICEYFLGQ